MRKNGRRTVPRTQDDPHYLQLLLSDVSPEDEIHITLSGVTVRRSPDKRELKIELISKLQGDNAAKLMYTRCIEEDADTVPASLKGPFAELNMLF